MELFNLFLGNSTLYPSFIHIRKNSLLYTSLIWEKHLWNSPLLCVSLNFLLCFPFWLNKKVFIYGGTYTSTGCMYCTLYIHYFHLLGKFWKYTGILVCVDACGLRFFQVRIFWCCIIIRNYVESLALLLTYLIFHEIRTGRCWISPNFELLKLFFQTSKKNVNNSYKTIFNGNWNKSLTRNLNGRK